MSKKILAINYMRGIMIFWVIILHAVAHRIYAGDTSEIQLLVENVPSWIISFLAPIAVLSLWGTAFSFLSGLSGAYSSASKMIEGKSLQKVILGRVYTGLGLYLVYFFERTFFRLLKIAAQTQSVNTYSLLDLTFMSTIEAMAIWNLILAGILYFSWKTGYNPQHTIKILILCVVLIIFGTMIFNQVFTDVPALEQFYIDNHQYGRYIIFQRLYANQFSLFPVGGFAMFGAAMGIILANKPEYSKVKRFGYGMGGILIGLGSLILASGFDLMNGFANTISPLPIDIINIGLQLWVITFLVKKFDYRSTPLTKKMQKSYEFFDKYGNLSLTIYLFEGILNILVYNLFIKAIGDTFRGDYSMMIVFTQSILIIWQWIVNMYHKFHYKYSIEWCLLTLKKGNRKKTQSIQKPKIPEKSVEKSKKIERTKLVNEEIHLFPPDGLQYLSLMSS